MTRARFARRAGPFALALLVSAGMASPSVAATAATAAQAARGPVLWYETARAVYLRSATGSVRKLTSTSGASGLAWSPDGTRAAWLTSTGHLVEKVLATGAVKTWKCTECDSPVFVGDTVFASSFEGKPRLLSYPPSGSAPKTIPVTGLPKTKFPPELDVFELLTATPSGQLIAGYGTGVSAAGGPQLLYRISAHGKATLLAPAKRQIQSNSVPFAFVYNAAGSHAAFVLPFEGGVCADTTEPVLAAVASGAETAPAMPKGLWSVTGLWYNASGTAYAALAHGPSHCTYKSKSVIQEPAVYRRAGRRWVKTGTGTIDAAYSAGGWQAVLSGKVYWTTLGGVGPQPGARLTIRHGSSKATITGAVAFGWLK
jgi:hypothetical protein